MGAEPQRELLPDSFDDLSAHIRKIQADRGYREASGLLYAEGVRNLMQAVGNRHEIAGLLYSERLLISPPARQAVRRLKRAGVPFRRLTPEQFRHISALERASGVAVSFRVPVLELPVLGAGTAGIWIGVSSIRQPGNLGALMRTVSAVAGSGLVLLGGRADPFHQGAVRGSTGALFACSLYRTTIEGLHDWASAQNVQLVGAAVDGSESLDSFRFARRSVILLGDERRGLALEERAACDALVRIPMSAATDSLNVAVAGSLLLYAARRTAFTTLSP